MRYIFKTELPEIKTFINRPVVGISYPGNTQIYFDQDGPVTVTQIHAKHPLIFEIVDTVAIKTQIVVNLSSQYDYLHKHYGNLTEDAMAQKISDLAEKICSKI